MQNRYESQIQQRDIHQQSPEQTSYRSRISGSERGRMYQRALEYQNELELQERQQQQQNYNSFSELKRFRAPSSQTNTFLTSHHQENGEKIITDDPSIQFMADTLSIPYELPRQQKEKGLVTGEESQSPFEKANPEVNGTQALPTKKRKRVRFAPEGELEKVKLFEVLGNEESSELKTETFQTGSQPREASSSQTRLDRVWPLDKKDELYKRIDHVSRSFSTIYGNHEINSNEAREYIRKCRNVLIDIKLAQNSTSYEIYRQQLINCFHEGDQLTVYKTDLNVQSLVDHFKSKLKEKGFVTEEESQSLLEKANQEDTGLFGPLSPLSPLSSP
jgi:hypothetical protein